MNEKRPLFIGRIILAFLIATVIFSSGFLVSYLVSFSKYQSISNSQQDIRYDLLNLEIQRELISSSCYALDINTLSQELENTGSFIGILEERFGKRAHIY